MIKVNYLTDAINKVDELRQLNSEKLGSHSLTLLDDIEEALKRANENHLAKDKENKTQHGFWH
ncbi:MAG: hypothetical protein FWE01_00860 [Firmicutes bacterium]|nr:hypothetical protein [Bacillota bacterium]